MSSFFPTYPHNKFPQTGTLASQPRGMNFAQTARAEELKAARARKAAHDDHEQAQQQQQQQQQQQCEQGLGLPTRGPIPLGAYTVFKKRTRTKHGKSQGRSERSRNENDSQEELSRPASTVPSIPEENEKEGNANVNAQTEPVGSAHKKRESMVSGYERYLREQANKAAGSASGLGRMPMPNEATSTTATNPTATSAFPFSQLPTISNIPTAAHAQDQNAGLNPLHHTGDFQWREDMSRRPTLVASYGRNDNKDYARLTPSSHQSSRISSLLTRAGPRYPATGGNDYPTFPPPGPATSNEGSASEDEDPFGYDGRQGISLNPAHPTNANAPSGKENGHAYMAKDPHWDHSHMNRTITQRDFPPHQIMQPAPLPPTAAPRASVRMPPAVKGTATDKSSRRGFPTFDPRKPRTAHGEAAAAGRTPMPDQHLHGYTDLSRRAAPNTTASGHVRDPHPYTGFIAPSNKTEMLMQSLDQRFPEEDPFKRSVLYDPVTDNFGGQVSQSLAIRPESSISVKHASSALRRDGFLGGLDFQRDLLNKSDPLPPVRNANGQEGDTNQARYSSQQNQRDDVFGAYPTTNALTTANIDYIREQQRQRQLRQRQEREENARFIPAYDTGFALEELANSYEPTSQAEQDAEVIAWFTKPYAEGANVRDMLSKANTHAFARAGNNNDDFDGAKSDNSTPPLTARYLQTRWDHTTAAPATEMAATLSSPAAGLDLLSPLLANLHTHQLNNFRDCPFTRYTMPPAWCVDTTGLPGSKDSFFGEGEGGWNPPKRVGRDKRRVMRVIEGRATYFEEGVGVGVVSPGSSAV